MVDKPDIVKKLREEEKLGKFEGSSQGSHEELEVFENHPEISFEDMSDETVDIGEEKKITNHNDTKAVFQISKDKYRLIAESTSDLITTATFTLNPIFTYISPSHKNAIGYETGDLIGKPLFDFVHPDDKKKLLSLLKKYISAKAKKLLTGKDFDVSEKVEIRFRDKSGNWRYMETTANLIGSEIVSVSRDVTDRKKTKEKMVQTEMETEAILDGEADGMRIVGKDFKVLKMNKTMADLAGVTVEQGIGMNCQEMFGLKGICGTKECYLVKVLKTGETIHCESVRTKKDGTPVPILEVISPYRDIDGNILGVIEDFRDITEIKEAEKELKESEEKYRTFVDTASDLMSIADKDGMFTDVNRAMARTLGYTKEKMIGMNIAKILTKESLENDFKPNWEELREEGKISIETTFAAKDGKEIYGELKAVAIYDRDGENVGSRVVFHDLTEHKQMEISLQENEEKFRTISASAQDGIIMMNTDENVTYWNESAERMFGYKYDEIIGKNLHMVLAPQKFHEAHKKGFSKFKDTGKGAAVGKTLELSALKKDGTEFPIELSMSSVKIKGKWNAIGIVRDITERKKAEEKLVGSERKFRTIFNSSSDAIFIHDLPDLTIVDANDETCKRFGYCLEELNHLTVNDLSKTPVFSTDSQESQEKMQKILQGETITEEWLSKTKTGTFIWHELKAKLVELDEQKKLLVQAKNINEQKKAEEELKDAHEMLQTVNSNLERKVEERTIEVEKLLKQKDEFVNQLGHDLKNPLGPLLTLLPVLEKDETDPERKKIFDVLNRNTSHIENLVVKTIQLAKLNSTTTKLSFEDTNLLGEIDDVIEKGKLLFEENNIEIENKTSEDIMVKADKLRLTELFDNLIGNSVKYSLDGGKITIDAKEEKDFVTVSIKDAGMGITEEQLSHIFDEFYKADWSRHDFDSSGLGLPICKRIVEKHGGKIWVESEGEGKGTTMFFTLPTSSEKQKDKEQQ